MRRGAAQDAALRGTDGGLLATHAGTMPASALVAGSEAEAAQLRARHRIAAPDAIQVAAAIGRRCPVFVTNDRALPVLENITVVQLRDLVPRGPSRRQPR